MRSSDWSERQKPHRLAPRTQAEQRNIWSVFGSSWRVSSTQSRRYHYLIAFECCRYYNYNHNRGRPANNGSYFNNNRNAGNFRNNGYNGNNGGYRGGNFRNQRNFNQRNQGGNQQENSTTNLPQEKQQSTQQSQQVAVQAPAVAAGGSKFQWIHSI